MTTWNSMGSAPLDRNVDLMIDGRRFTDCRFYPSHLRWGRKETRGSGASTYEIDRIFTGLPEPTHWADIELPEEGA